MALLTIENVTKRYGGVTAIDRLSMTVGENLTNGLIGPNGAGKSTLFNLITCIERPTRGKIYFRDREITHSSIYHVSELGIARTFQNLCLFENMSVLENVVTGLHIHTRSNLLSAGLRFPGFKAGEKRAEIQAKEILGFIGLADKAHFRATELPYGEQRLLEIARALATKPALLLLDEPAAGLNSKETEVLADKIIEIRKSGVSLFLVEHDMNLVMMVSDFITVLNYGQMIANGTPEEIRNNPEVIRRYLGERSSSVC